MNQGWNLISLPVIVSNTAIANVLSGIADNMESARYYNGTNWVIYKPGVTNDLTTVEDGKGYWIFMNNAATLNVTGVKTSVDNLIPLTYPVISGWNLIGFKSTISMLSKDYLSSLPADSYTLMDAANNNKNNSSMDSGYGYWLWMNSAGNIIPGAN